jgi:hypothetical protein
MGGWFSSKKNTIELLEQQQEYEHGKFINMREKQRVMREKEKAPMQNQQQGGKRHSTRRTKKRHGTKRQVR